MRHFGSLKVTRQAIEPVWHFTQGWKRRGPEQGEKALGIRNKIVLYAQESAYAIKWSVQAGIASSYSSSLEKEMATHYSAFAWKIPWTEKPGGLQSLGSQRVGHDWVTSHHILSHSCSRAFQVALVVKNLPADAKNMRCRFFPWVGKILWKRAWQPTPIFLLGESHWQESLVGYGP